MRDVSTGKHVQTDIKLSVEKKSDFRNLKKRTTYIENDPRQQIAARLKVLEELGYTEAQTLLPRGNTAAHLYGYEVQLTQLLFGGFFERAYGRRN